MLFTTPKIKLSKCLKPSDYWALSPREFLLLRPNPNSNMPFPLPLDPQFRKEVIRSWIDDVDDRVNMGDLDGAEKSWQTANHLYLKLPAGKGDAELERHLVASGVKLTEYPSIKTKCEPYPTKPPQ